MWKRYRFLLVASLLCIFLLQGPQTAEGLVSSYVENFDIYPHDVYIKSTPQIVTFTLHLVNESGSAILPLLEPPRALFESTFPNSHQTVAVEFNNIRDRVFKGTAQLDDKIDPGKWELANLRLTNSQDDILDLRDELAANNISTNFFVMQSGMGSSDLIVYGSGFIVIIILGILYYFWSGFQPLSRIYRGEDGASSVSKLQLLIWTLVAILSYTWIYADRVFNHNSFAAPSGGIPINLLLAMGLSVGTTLAAKLVTSTQVRSGKVHQQITDQPKGGIFLNDDGVPDLSKIQMIAWTFIAVGIYLISVVEITRMNFLLPELPDINPTLLALMGIGEGAYIGKKIVTEDDPKEPRLSTISPEVGHIGTLVTLTGSNFGEYSTKDGKYINDATHKILIGNRPIDDPTGTDFEWSNTQIKFRIPESVAGEKMAPRETNIGLVANDKQCSKPKPFKVIDPDGPYLYNINLREGPAGSNVILTGVKFGKTAGKILIDDNPLSPDEWTNDRIDFKIPSSSSPTLGLGSKSIKISIQAADGNKSQNLMTFKVTGSS